ncbi:MAG: long-chain fatty acid--CoA ligase [Spirochaetes bacterium]|nr:long-chain fatty acid--CoA ligase [Spirochaetota bacterium]
MEQTTKQRYSYVLDKPDNLVEMFEETLSKFGDKEWMGTKNGSGVYEWVTYKQVAKRIDNLRAGLASLGVGEGDSVGIIDNNSVAWATACFATYGLCAKFVPMYKVELPKIWKYIVEDSNVKVLFVSGQDIFDKVKEWPGEVKTLLKVIRIEGTGPGTMDELEKTGEGKPVKAKHPGPDDVAGLIYTSGTTGDPKGVLLTHGNFTSNAHAIIKILKVLDENVRTLSFLPWAHSYGQTGELNVVMRLGGSTGFAESPQTIVDDIAVVKPNFLVAVPRVFNRIYDGLCARMNETGGLAKALFTMGVAAGRRRRELAAEGKKSAIVNMKLAFADKIVFSKIRARFGNNLKNCISSSAALSPVIAEFFFDIGIPIYEAWGMTEISPGGTMNSPSEYKIGSCGKALDKVTLFIDRSVIEDDPNGREGELVIYGPNVMKGYHNKPEETRATMTDDGGLRTGDRAFVDQDGFMYITGRIKEQFKLENGKFVFPVAMQEEITLLPVVEQTMIYGLNKPYTICLVYPDFAVMKKIAEQNRWPAEPQEMVKHPDACAYIEKEITGHLKGKFGSYEVPKKFLILSEGFTLQNGLLTQTFKLKRKEVLKRYEAEIEALYNVGRC